MIQLSTIISSKHLRRCFALLLVFLSTTTYGYSQDYAASQVEAMTHSYFGVSGTTTRAARIASTIQVDTLFLGEKPKMFLCQDGEHWVVLANEQLVTPVVCHGEGQLSLEELYDSPLWFLLTESMIGLDSLRILGEEANTEYVVADNEIVPLASSTAMTPLLDKNTPNRWGQSSNNGGTTDINKSYNKFCPAFYNSSNGRTLVGCTAVAMGQILWYWKWPSSARIPVSINKSGITSSEYETHFYDWTKMPGRIYNSTPIEQINNVAGLLRDCGYSGNMIYSDGWSSMTLTNAIYALRNDFNYSAHMKQYSAGATKFNNIIKSEIAAGRPVMIQATHVSDAGTHTFIIDGYDSNAEEYHINMGWKEDERTAWYSVSGTNSYGNYRIARRMLYEIIPNSSATSASEEGGIIEEDASETEKPIQLTVQGNTLIIQHTADNIQWNIYDLYGQVILSGTESTADISALPTGTYTIVAVDDDSVEQIRIIR